jgi:hypothetical protein
VIAARLEAPRAGIRPVTVTAPARRAGLAWPRLPAGGRADRYLIDEVLRHRRAEVAAADQQRDLVAYREKPDDCRTR